jgi:mannose-1-phosphate guanylyltransferase
MEVDRHGNLFGAGPGGVHVFAADATHLGSIFTGVATSNCAWGGDGTTLFHHGRRRRPPHPHAHGGTRRETARRPGSSHPTMRRPRRSDRTTPGRGRLWAVVLAAGEGRRLGSLTRALYGQELPKQFAVLDGQRSLLQATMERIAPLVPPERTVVVVGAAHERVACEQLRCWPEADVVLQPRNLDTGPGILLPLARVPWHDPTTTVVVFPSDHYVADPAPWVRAVRRAVAATAMRPGQVVLLGIVPTTAETEYGWILPAQRAAGGTPVRIRRFVEKPSARRARTLLRRGALWNTFVLVGRVSAFWTLAVRHLPEHAELFRIYAEATGRFGEEDVLRDIYAAMRAANFSRDILEKADDLAVLPVDGSGWSDWGTPSRVYETLGQAGRLAALESRLIAVPQAGVA